MRHRIARTGAIALALAAFTGSASGAEEPVEALRLTRLGGSEPAAAFSVATPGGTTVGLGDLRGKVVLLNFWATWCEPCLEERADAVREKLRSSYTRANTSSCRRSMLPRGPSVRPRRRGPAPPRGSAGRSGA